MKRQSTLKIFPRSVQNTDHKISPKKRYIYHTHYIYSTGCQYCITAMCVDCVVNNAQKVIYVEEKRKPSIWSLLVSSFCFMHYRTLNDYASLLFRWLDH